MVDTETKTSKVNAILRFFPIGVPLAYLTGYLYQQGYLSSYGFSSEAFFQTPEYYFVNFFIAVSMSFFWGLGKVLKQLVTTSFSGAELVLTGDGLDSQFCKG